ncbi:hypothetical protein ACTXT7_002263 [Hymenolepis weldensis]
MFTTRFNFTLGLLIWKRDLIALLRNMKGIFVVLTTLLVTIVLIASADEEKGHVEDKRMIYWKRSGLENLEDEGLH